MILANGWKLTLLMCLDLCNPCSELCLDLLGQCAGCNPSVLRPILQKQHLNHSQEIICQYQSDKCLCSFNLVQDVHGLCFIDYPGDPVLDPLQSLGRLQLQC